jgi:hypothetical protein
VMRLEREVKRLNVAALNRKEASIVCFMILEHYSEGKHSLHDIAQLASSLVNLNKPEGDT